MQKFLELYKLAPIHIQQAIDSGLLGYYIHLIFQGNDVNLKRQLLALTSNMLVGVEVEEFEVKMKSLFVNNEYNFIIFEKILFVVNGILSNTSDDGLNDTLRFRHLNNCSPSKKFFFLSVENSTKLYEIARKYDFHGMKKYQVLSTTIGDIILGFYRIEDTVPLLQQELSLDPRTAALLGADVLEFLAPLSDPNWQPPAEEEGGEGDTETIGDEPARVSINSDSAGDPVMSMDDVMAEVPPVVTENNIPQASFPPESNAVSVNDDLTERIPRTSSPYQDLARTPFDEPRRREVEPPVNQEPSNQPLPNFHYEPVYKSSQSDLRTPLSGTPDYGSVTPPTNKPDIDPPRWHSR